MLTPIVSFPLMKHLNHRNETIFWRNETIFWRNETICLNYFLYICGMKGHSVCRGGRLWMRALKKVPVFGKTNKKAASYCTSEQFSDGQILNLFCLTQWLR